MWIKQVMSSTEESESPSRYFYWAAISAISAVARRNIYLDKFYYILYPNLYVLLVGESGLRKGVPIALAQKLVSKINCTRVISGRGSIQGIIKNLSQAFTLPDKSLITDAIGFLVSSEFDAMLVKDDSAFTLLTDLYDTHFKTDWKNIIKIAGTDHLKNIYLSLIGASNETNLMSAIPKNAIGGGFVARTIIVLEEKRRLLNDLTNRPKVIPDYDALSKRLFEISNLKGEFKYDNLAKETYQQWYASFMKVEGMDKTGTLERIHDTILKVAMCIALSRKNDLVLLKDEIEEATDECLSCVAGMKKVFLGSGEHSLAKPTAMILKMLIIHPEHKLSRKRMLTDLYGTADAYDLDRIIDTLSQSGAIDSYQNGKDIFYVMKNEIVSQYSRIIKEMN